MQWRILGDEIMRHQIDTSRTFKFLKPLGYDVKLNKTEVETRFEEVRTAFGKIKDKSQKPSLMKLLRRLDKDSRETLTECTGVLLSLSHKEAVRKGESQIVTPHTCNRLATEITIFLAGFRNTEETIAFIFKHVFFADSRESWPKKKQPTPMEYLEKE